MHSYAIVQPNINIIGKYDSQANQINAKRQAIRRILRFFLKQKNINLI